MSAKAKLQKQYLYTQLADLIRQDIKAGKYPTGALPTEQELVSDSGLSTITVRKALDCLVKEGIIVRRQGKGTFIKKAIELGTTAKTRRKTRMFCLVSGPGGEMTTGTFFNRVMVKTQNVAEANGYNAILSSSNKGEIPNPVARRRIDGVLLAGTFREGNDIRVIADDLLERNDEYVAKLVDSGYPVVCVSNPSTSPAIVNVAPDYGRAMTEICEQFASHGHKRVCFCGGPLVWPAFADRYAAYKDAAKRFDLETNDIILQHAIWMDPGAVVQNVRKLVSSADRPTALICGSGSPQPIFDGLEGAGLSVPGDISVVAFADRAPGDKSLPADADEDVPLSCSTWTIEVEELARVAMESLLSLIEGQTLENNDIRLPLSVYPGSTIGPCNG